MPLGIGGNRSIAAEAAPTDVSDKPRPQAASLNAPRARELLWEGLQSRCLPMQAGSRDLPA